MLSSAWMARNEWTESEVAAIVDDYFAMLAAELAGTPYNKAEHNRQLREKLGKRSRSSVEFKHQNISGVLVEQGMPYLRGYKPLSNYQEMLGEVVLGRLSDNVSLLDLTRAEVERPAVVPEVADILRRLVERPVIEKSMASAAAGPVRARIGVNYALQESNNRSLGQAGEKFAMNYERARLIAAGREALADRVEHTSAVQGDGVGFDIRSFDDRGRDRLIEVKTTNFGKATPFFVSRNEVRVSVEKSEAYRVMRLFTFRDDPHFYELVGSVQESCHLSPSTFQALPR